MMRIAGSSLVLAFVLLSSTATSAALPVGRALLNALEDGDTQRVRKLVDRFDEAAIRETAEDPQLARELCWQASSQVAGNFELLSDEQWEAFAGRLRLLGDQVVARSPESRYAHGARAAAHYCGLLVADESGRKTTAQQWLDCAALYYRTCECDPEDHYWLERALSVCLVGLGIDGVDPGPLDARARELCAEGSKTFPDNPYFLERRLNYRLTDIETLLGSDREAGEAKLTEYLSELQRKATEAEPDAVYETACADAVTVAKSLKRFKLATEYLPRQIQAGARRLMVDLPRSARWEWTPGKELSEGFGLATQRNRDGSLLHVIEFHIYHWGTNYYSGHTDIQGDNLKALAIMDFDSLKEEHFRKIKKQRKPSRRRLNQHIAKAYGYEMCGINKDDRQRRVVAYFFKDETRKCTYLIRITGYRGHKSLDPEAQFVIDSVRFP